MMTDFQNWWDGYFHEINGQKETAQAAWLARGERIKELEAELAEWKEVGLGHDENARQAIKQLAELTAKNKAAEESELLALRNNDGLRMQINELSAKLDKARDGDCCTEGCIKCDARKILAETQEPVLYIDGGGLDGHATWAQAIRCQDTYIDLYTTPSREWQSLSVEEIEEAVNFLNVKIDYPIMFARIIEMHLKAKNG